MGANMKSIGNYAFVNCNLWEGIPDKAILKDAVVLVNNIGQAGMRSGIIENVGVRGSVDIPSDYKVIDLQGKFILPGLINAHIHLFGNGKPMKAYTSDMRMKMIIKLLKTPVLKAVLQAKMRSNALTQLKSGVTTIRCVGDFFYTDIKVRKDFESGKYIGPRVITCGRAISVTGGHGASGFTLISDSPWEARKCARLNLAKEVDFIKIFSTGGVLDGRKIGDAGLRKMTVDEMRAVCDEAHRAGLMTVAHVESKEGVREALLAGVDTIEHGAEMDDEIVKLFKNNPMSLKGYSALVPTLFPAIVLAELETCYSKLNRVNRENAAIVSDGMISGLKRAVKEGIKVGLGTDASVPFATHYDTWRELECRVKVAGIEPMEAMYQATAANAEILGIKDETGTVEIGKSADFVVVDGDPIENMSILSKPNIVVMSGNIISNPHVKKIKSIDSLIESILWTIKK
jgi:imidazolonepropionase-like amidohydrolase